MTIKAVNRYLEHSLTTPLVPIQWDEGSPIIWCKLEFMNPSGSTKDRIARYILGKAVRSGCLHPGQWVVEASSGSTSIALALVAAQLGLRFLAVMPEGVSNERMMIIRGYGGSVEFTPKSLGIQGSIDRADELAEKWNAFRPQQFINPDNAEAHRHQTAQEIVNQIPNGCVDVVVSGVGTGGTLVGLYQGFRDHGCQVVPVAARPISNNAINTMDVECCSFSYRIPGVVDGLSRIYREADLPGLIEEDVLDEHALTLTRKLMSIGFPVGPSSGLNLRAALQVAERLPHDKQIVTVFPDRMERYFSTELFAPCREQDQDHPAGPTAL